MKVTLFTIILFLSNLVYAQELPVLGKVEGFDLTDSNNQNITFEKNLLGKNWFAIFMFTSCPHVCPRLVSQLKSFADKNPTANYVAFSVDPKTDRPIVLKKFSSKYGLDKKKNWKFLTGEEKYILTVIEQQFLVPTKLKIHTQKAILIDKKGLLRGYYSLESEQKQMKNALVSLN